MIRVSFRIIHTLPFTALVITTKPSHRVENFMDQGKFDKSSHLQQLLILTSGHWIQTMVW